MPAGGKRVGAGGRPGHRSRATILNKRKTAAIIESGLSPLDVMMSNLRFWNKEVGTLEKCIRTASGKPDGSILLMERTPLIESYFDARGSLQVAAEKAAQYVHPRISPVSDTTAGGIKDLSKLSNAELDALERISRKIAGSYGDPGGKTPA